MLSERNLFFAESVRASPTSSIFPRQHYGSEYLPVKMGLFVLSETSAGFALFKARDKHILKKDDFSTIVETAEGLNEL
tara:strand:+ start:858 stop:1091 length:234 start_codon:yes stop_codon:yes gene_type:complete